MGVIKKGGITFAGVSTLQELQDVTIDTLTLSNGQILKYNALNDKWENKDGSIQLSELTDIDFSTPPVDGNVLVYDEANDVWIPGAGGSGGIPDFNISSPTDGQMLKYDGTSQKWVNYGTILTDTLAAGDSEITFANAAITTDSDLQFKTSIYGVNPIGVSVSQGSLTLVFDPQSSALGVKVVIA